MGARWDDLYVTAGQDIRPPSFDAEYSEDWARWVLRHGLPELPDALGEADEVPIACWAGPRFGAVVLRRWWDDDDGDRSLVDDNVVLFERVESDWRPLNGDGGAAGPLLDPMARPLMPAGEVRITGETGSDSVRAVDGVVGEGVRYIELDEGGGPIRRAIEAPVGVFVLCFAASDEAKVRFLDQDEACIREHQFEPSQDW